MLSCPPTSLKPVQKYFLRLASHGIPYHNVLTRFALTKERNRDGISYSAIVPTMVGRLPRDEVEHIAQYIALLQPSLSKVQATEEDFTD